MAIRTKTQFKALYGASGTEFPDNTTGAITPTKHRSQGEDLTDSFINKLDELYKTFGVTASGTDTYTATADPAITAYTTDTRFYIKFTNANTGAATLNLNTLGAKSIVKSGSTALASGDISAGQILELIYDGTNFQIVGGGGSGGGVLKATGKLTAPQILTLGTGGGISVVPAPGENKILMFHGASLKLVFESTPYATHTICRFEIGFSVLSANLETILPATETVWSHVAHITNTLSSSIENVPIKIKATTGNPTDGDSEIQYTVFYSVVDVEATPEEILFGDEEVLFGSTLVTFDD